MFSGLKVLFIAFFQWIWRLKFVLEVVLCSHDHPGTINIASACPQNRILPSFPNPRDGMPRCYLLRGTLGRMCESILISPHNLLEMEHTQAQRAFSS